MSDELSCDEILRGRLRLWQPKKGYRFTIDPVLLLHFVGARKIASAVDLGSGCGILALGLAQTHPEAKVTAVELQPRLAGLARKNAMENGLADRVTVVEADVTSGTLPGGKFDLALSNPPYFLAEQGSFSPDEEYATARHDAKLPLEKLVAQAKRVLGPTGSFALVYPTDRMVELLGLLDGAGLTPMRARLVHPQPNAPAHRILVEAQKGRNSPLVVEPPFFVRDEANEYTREALVALGETQSQ